MTSYLIEGQLTTGQYFLFLARDIATAVGFIVARFIPGLTIASFRARFLGKAVTVLQLATLIAVLILPATVQILVILIGLVSAVSIVDYTMALERARRALEHLRPEDMILAPDCGMKYLPREVAFGKMKAMVEGARLLRAEYR